LYIAVASTVTSRCHSGLVLAKRR